MSSVVISGDTSGAITLSAPAIAGTNTLTLPAQTATIATLTTPSFATTIGVGGATAAASGAGITFPASQSASSDANTLDDYEEGTFTPVLAASGSGPTVTYTVQQGRYTKVGRLVYIEIYLRLTSYSGGSGNVRIGGLPFTAAASPYGYVILGETTGITTTGTYYSLQGGVDASGTTISLLKAAPNSATTAVVLSEIGSSTTVYFLLSGCYTV
jgi:hypothetical protein